MTKLQALEMQAMKLDPRSRAKLAQRLILSLNGVKGIDVEEAWFEEAERRGLELQQGLVAGRPAAAVLQRVRRQLSRKRSRSIR